MHLTLSYGVPTVPRLWRKQRFPRLQAARSLHSRSTSLRQVRPLATVGRRGQIDLKIRVSAVRFCPWPVFEPIPVADSASLDWPPTARAAFANCPPLLAHCCPQANLGSVPRRPGADSPGARRCRSPARPQPAPAHRVRGQETAMIKLRILRVLMGAFLPAAVAAQQPPRTVEPQQAWKLDTGG